MKILITFYLILHQKYGTIFSGPLTFTENGKATVYGIVSARGVVGELTEVYDRRRTLYHKISTNDSLNWINEYLEKYDK